MSACACLAVRLSVCPWVYLSVVYVTYGRDSIFCVAIHYVDFRFLWIKATPKRDWKWLGWEQHGRDTAKILTGPPVSRTVRRICCWCSHLQSARIVSKVKKKLCVPTDELGLLQMTDDVFSQWRRSCGGPGGQRTLHFPEWGSRIRLWPPVLTPCRCHFFRLICWLCTETVVDQVLLWFRPTLILSRIPWSVLHIKSDGIRLCAKFLFTFTN